MAKQRYEEPYNPRKLSLPKQEDYYRKLSNFWVSVANKYPSPYNKNRATIFSRDLARVKQEMKNE